MRVRDFGGIDGPTRDDRNRLTAQARPARLVLLLSMVAVA
jgi:hypothetical protein